MTFPAEATPPADPPPAAAERIFVPRRRSAARTALTLVGLGAAAVAGWWGYARFAAAAAPEAAGKKGPRTLQVVTARVRLGDLPIHLDCLGSVAAFNLATVRSRVDGELVKLHFDEGQTVNAGDLLAEIDPRPYEVLLAQAQGALLRESATLRNAQLTLERDKPLRAAEVLAPQDYDAQATLVRQSEGAVAAARAQVENAKLNLSFCRIATPFAGRIGLRKVDVGNYVRAADAAGLLTVVQTRPIAVVFSVPQDAIAAVQRQQALAPLAVEIHGRELGAPLAQGVVSALDNQVDPASGTVRIKATAPNLDDALFPNQFVGVRLRLDVRRGAALAPAAAVRHGPESDFVYVVKADGVVESRPVKAGPVEGDVALIETGVAAGEAVVVQGLDKLQAGMKVEARDAAAPAGAAKPAPPRGRSAP